MTKTDRIKGLLNLGWNSREIAEEVGCTVHYVCQVRWYSRRPGYNARWMRRKRAEDPAYYQRELDQQNGRRRAAAQRTAP